MTTDDHFVLRYSPLRSDGRSLRFPCDERGRIALDALPERIRNQYLFARAVVGRIFAPPVVECLH